MQIIVTDYETFRECSAVKVCSQPLPSVEPAWDLALLLDELDASFLPAADNAALDGFAMVITSFRVQ